ncbi:phage tail protein [Plesiomonas shigelloides]|uniref:phage tail protein n=1 Tax=Plesiomonas shigelloides TaxID=703 RepID=UPI0012625CF7|nr:phage tail protein [Plesiomonas shigelloides]KAB7668106.1 phage tail protein [Plesiomonas shigelloides]
MAAKYFAILTNLGAAKLANATALGTQLEITHMAVGDGGGGLPIPNPAQTALIGERRRAAINLLTIDPLNNSQIISEQVIPEDVGGWWIREVGLFDKDGALVAIANCPETYKPQLQEGSGRTQTIRVILIVSSTQSVSLKIDPSVVLATRKYVDDNVIEVRTYADQLMESHVADTNPHKQYAMVAKNGSDIPDKSAFRENIGVRSAGVRDVGDASNQIPDMSFFGSSANSFKLPGGWMIIIGEFNATIPHSSSGEIASTEDVTFPVPFPVSCNHVSGAFLNGIGNGPLSYTCERPTRNSFVLRASIASPTAGPSQRRFSYIALGKYK